MPQQVVLKSAEDFFPSIASGWLMMSCESLRVFISSSFLKVRLKVMTDIFIKMSHESLLLKSVHIEYVSRVYISICKVRPGFWTVFLATAVLVTSIGICARITHWIYMFLCVWALSRCVSVAISEPVVLVQHRYIGTGIPRYTRSHFTRFRYNAI